MNRFSILFFLFINTISLFSHAQKKSAHRSAKSHGEETFSCVFSCWSLDPDSTIRPLKLNSDYTGRVMIRAQIDTNAMRLMNYEFRFVKLRSRSNPDDTIKIRIDYKTGNYVFFDSIKAKIIGHIQYLKVKRMVRRNCDNNLWWSIPVRIE